MKKHLNNLLPNLISVIAVALLGMITAKIVVNYLDKDSDVYMDPKTNPASGKLEQQNEQTNYARIINQHHLFGQFAAADNKQGNDKPVEVKKTRLNLTLHGTIAYSDQTGFAMISSGGKAQKTYAVGEKIGSSGQTILSKIYPDHVLLDRNGELETLELPKKKEIVTTNNRSSTRPAPASRVGGDDLNVNKDNLNDVRDQLLANPAALYKIMRVAPVTSKGKFQGYRVNPGKNKKAFEALGFEPGDIVSSVNGEAIDSPQKGMEIFKNMTTSDTVNVEVKRGEETVTLTGMF